MARGYKEPKVKYSGVIYNRNWSDDSEPQSAAKVGSQSLVGTMKEYGERGWDPKKPKKSVAMAS